MDVEAVYDALQRLDVALDEWAQGDEWAEPMSAALADLHAALDPPPGAPRLTVLRPSDDDLRSAVLGALSKAHGGAAEEVCCLQPVRYADAILAALAPLLVGEGT